MPTIGQLYTIDASSGNGFLVVAYPNFNVSTNLEFTFWEEQRVFERANDEDAIFEEDEEEDLGTLYAVLAIGVLLVALCICVICVIRKKRSMVNKIGMEVLPEPTER